MVEQADALRHAFQRGDDEAMLRIIASGDVGGLQQRLMSALEAMSDRSATYAAPYIADLAKRLAWLQREDDRINGITNEGIKPEPTYPE
jgi:hypothetical protein